MPEREGKSSVTVMDQASTGHRGPSISLTEIRRSLTKQISLRVSDIRRNIFPSDTTPSAREEALKAPPPKRKKYSLETRRRTSVVEGFAGFRDCLWEEFFELQTWRITRPYLVLITVIMSLYLVCRVGLNIGQGWSVFHAMLQFLIFCSSVAFNLFFLWIDTRYCEPQLQKRDSKTVGLRKIRKYGLIMVIAYGLSVFITTHGHVWDRMVGRPAADHRLSWFSMLSALLSVTIVFFRLPMCFAISLLVFVFVVYFVAGYLAEAPYIVHLRVLLFELTCAAIVIFTITCLSYRSELISRYIFSKPAQREIQELHASASKRSSSIEGGEGDGSQRSDCSSTGSSSLIYGMPLLHHEQLLIEAYVGGRYSLYFNDNMEEFAYRNEVFQSIKSSALIYIAAAFMVVVLVIDGCLPLVLVYSATISPTNEVFVLVLRIVPFVVIFICFILAMTRNAFSEPEVPRRDQRQKCEKGSQGKRKTTFDRMMIALSHMRLKPNMVHMNTALPSALILLYLVYIMITWDVILQLWGLLPYLDKTQYFRLPLVTSLTSCGIMILRLSFAHAMVFVLSVFFVYVSLLIYLIINGEFLRFETFDDTKIIIFEILTIGLYCYILLISARKAEFQSRIMYMLQELEMNSTAVMSVYELRRQSERRKIAKEHWSRATLMAAREESADSSVTVAAESQAAEEERSKKSGINEKPQRAGSPIPRSSVTSIKPECDNTATVHRLSFSSEAPSTCLHSNFTSSAGRRTTELTSILSCINNIGPIPNPHNSGGEATISSPSSVSNTHAGLMQEDNASGTSTTGGGGGGMLLGAQPLGSEAVLIPIENQEIEKGRESLSLCRPSFDPAAGGERGRVTEDYENPMTRASIPTITLPPFASVNAHDEDDDDDNYDEKGKDTLHPARVSAIMLDTTYDDDEDEDDEVIKDLLQSLSHQDTRPNQEPGDGDDAAMFALLPHVVYSDSGETAAPHGGDAGGQNSGRAKSTSLTTMEKRSALIKPIKPIAPMNDGQYSFSQCAHTTTYEFDDEKKERHSSRHTTAGSGSNGGSKGGQQQLRAMDDVIPRESSSSSRKDSDEIPKKYHHIGRRTQLVL